MKAKELFGYFSRKRLESELDKTWYVKEILSACSIRSFYLPQQIRLVKLNWIKPVEVGKSVAVVKANITIIQQYEGTFAYPYTWLFDLNREEERWLILDIRMDDQEFVVRSSDEQLKEVPLPPGLFCYGGSTTFAPLRVDIDDDKFGLIEAIDQSHPKTTLSYTLPPNIDPGSGSGIQLLLSGELSFAESSRAITTDEQKAAGNLGIRLLQIPCALDGIAVFTHPKISSYPKVVPTTEQLAEIYLGRITNWKRLGGPNLDILPLSRNPTLSGTAHYFWNNILHRQNFSKNVVIKKYNTEMIKTVLSTPGAIGFASTPQLIRQREQRVHILHIVHRTRPGKVSPYDIDNDSVNLHVYKTREYPLTRRLFVIVRLPDSPSVTCESDTEMGMGYARLLLSKQGQQFLKEHGFLPIETSSRLQLSNPCSI